MYCIKGILSSRCALIADLINSEVGTPGTSDGYCIARNSPARALSSTSISNTSSPSNKILPPSTSYLG